MTANVNLPRPRRIAQDKQSNYLQMDGGRRVSQTPSLRRKHGSLA